MMLGAHCIKGYSSTQATVALSSGEAELYAMTKGAATALGLISLAMDFGIKLDGLVHCDASAALGIVNRQGLGKLRHINVRYLWLQEKVRSKELDVLKVAGVENPADLMTKNLDAETMKKHVSRLGFYVEDGRAESAPKLRPGVVNGDVFMAGELSLPDDTIDDPKVTPLSSSSQPPVGDKRNDNPCQGVGSGFQTVTTSGASTLQTRDGEIPVAGTTTRAVVESRDRTESVESSVRGGVASKEESESKADLGCWIRIVHSKPRLCLATPLRVQGVPPIKALTAMRVTTGRYIDNGEAFRVVDNWTARAQAHAELDRRWTGSSWFLTKEPPRISPSQGSDDPSMGACGRDRRIGSGAPSMPSIRRDARAAPEVSGSVMSLSTLQPRSLGGSEFVHVNAVVSRVALCEWTRSAFSNHKYSRICSFDLPSPPFKTFRPKIETQFPIRRSGAVGGSELIELTVYMSGDSSGSSSSSCRSNARYNVKDDAVALRPKPFEAFPNCA